MPAVARTLFLAFVAVGAFSPAIADSTPVMVSLLAPAQVPSWDSDVSGFRLSLLYGDCHDFAGLDIGVVSRTSGAFDGLGVGGVNIANGRLRGIQAGLFNWSGCEATASGFRPVGVQYGGINCADAFLGLQSGFVSISTGELSGVQYGLLNCACGLDGVQCGQYLALGVNVVYGSAYGCQVGILNYAQEMTTGVQIGILNIIVRNGIFPVLPIVNAGF